MLKVVFAGTPEFARVALEAIYDAGHEVVMVMTQPDRPAGRGLQLQPSPVKQFAQAKHLPVIQPHSLRVNGDHAADAKSAIKALQACDFDVMVVAAYGLILPQEVFEIAEQPNRLGCLNIHASLLPRWRGAAQFIEPLRRATERRAYQSCKWIWALIRALSWPLKKYPLRLKKQPKHFMMH